MEREIVRRLAENAIIVVEKTTSAKCVDPVRDPTSLSQSMTQGSLTGLLVNVLTDAKYMRLTSGRMTWGT